MPSIVTPSDDNSAHHPQTERLSDPSVAPPDISEVDTRKASRPPQESGVTIRVNLDRVDRLMNMIGELVIKEAILSQLIETVGLSENLKVSGGLNGIRQLADEIKDSVMAIRAQPLGSGPIDYAMIS